jgi:hypothetical protein
MKTAAKLLAATVCSLMLPAAAGPTRAPEAMLATPAFVVARVRAHEAFLSAPVAARERGTAEVAVVLLGLVAYQLRRRHRILQQAPRP